MASMANWNVRATTPLPNYAIRLSADSYYVIASGAGWPPWQTGVCYDAITQLCNLVWGWLILRNVCFFGTKISRMLPRLDGRIRAPRRSFGGSSKGQLAFIFWGIPARTRPDGHPYGSDGHPYASAWVRNRPSGAPTFQSFQA